MAVGATIKSVGMVDERGDAPVLARGQWVTCHDNIEATATSAAHLINPFAIDEADFHWIQVPQGARRFFVRFKCDDALTTVTDGLFRVFGLDADPNDSAATNAGTNAMRLDTTNWGSGGNAMGFQASGAGMHTDGTNFITNMLPATLDANSGYQVAGNKYVGVAVQQAAALGGVTGGTAQILFLP